MPVMRIADGLAEKSFSCENRSCMCWSKRFQTKRTFIYLGFGRTGCHIIFSFERETPTGHEVAEVLFRQKKNGKEIYDECLMALVDVISVGNSLSTGEKEMLLTKAEELQRRREEVKKEFPHIEQFHMINE
ncbi:hypothetical protein L798_00388 [Zootermopsis nevadensis]|uniref:Uncharacterized protein n=1 Tax=Zootermopsis nevadensis TaxID=136037 RepID=A0A067RDC6_ZOONE|nr:hypothetical protein L798_00388 [Zootermopsis nevadensis]